MRYHLQRKLRTPCPSLLRYVYGNCQPASARLAGHQSYTRKQGWGWSDPPSAATPLFSIFGPDRRFSPGGRAPTPRCRALTSRDKDATPTATLSPTTPPPQTTATTA